jgi:hypothetical protein
MSDDPRRGLLAQFLSRHSWSHPSYQVSCGVDHSMQAGVDNSAEAHKVQQWSAEGQTGGVDPHHSAYDHGSQIQHQQARHDLNSGLPLLQECTSRNEMYQMLGTVVLHDLLCV